LKTRRLAKIGLEGWTAGQGCEECMRETGRKAMAWLRPIEKLPISI